MSDNILKRNTDNFSIVDTVASIAVNPEFKKGYFDLRENLNTEKAFVWKAMNEIGDEISETIYDNIVNYIDNVGNIDTCKVRALFSMSEVLGVVNNGLKNLIDHLPDEVLHLVDLFSINKAFSTKLSVNCSALTDALRNAALDILEFKKQIQNTENAVNSKTIGISDGTFLSNAVFDFNVPESTYRSFVSASFFNCLSSHIYNTYDGIPLKSEDLSTDKRFELPIYETIVYNWDEVSKGYVVNMDVDLSVDHGNFAIGIDEGNTANLLGGYKEIEKLRKTQGLFDFNPYKVATDVMDGNDLIDKYSGIERELIDNVLSIRAAPLTNNNLTRYAYYHRKDASDYLSFVDRFYNATSKTGKLDLDGITLYDIDPEFLLVTKKYVEENRTRVFKKTGVYTSATVEIDNKCLSSVAISLADLCFTISNIREKLKTQAQRNHMRGTFLLISYIVGEYLKKNIAKTYDLNLDNWNHIDYYDASWNVNIIEYADTTEYYNLSTVTTPVALSGNTVNYRFWEADGDDVTGIGLPQKDLDYFYLSTLNLRTATSSTSSFLNVIFELGADKGYIDRRTGNMVPGIVADDIYDKIEADFETMSAKYYMLSDYQTGLFKTYGGNKMSYDPYYNWKNMAHASYQIHPYLERFVEWSSLQYSIRSAYGGNSNEEVLAALKTEAISTILGEMGTFQNIWDRNANDSTGWKSRYETETHDMAGLVGYSNRLQHYDGVFYPSAIEEYIEITGISSWNDALSKSGVDNGTVLSNIVPSFLSALSSDEISDNINFAQLETVYGEITSRKLTADISSAVYGFEKLALERRSSYKESVEWGKTDSGKFIHFDWLSLSYDAEADIDDRDRYIYDFSSCKFLAPYFRYVRNMHDSAIVLKNEYAPDEQKEYAEKTKRVALSRGFEKTFYEKWYSHLNLPFEDIERIVARLIYYHDDIVSVYKNSESKQSTDYDMFRYGLDKYADSIILYKSSDSRIPDYENSRNLNGEIWLKFNSHPIGFPIYSTNKYISQVEHGGAGVDNRFEKLMSSQMGESLPFEHDKKNPRIFKDIEMTKDYGFIVLGYDVNKDVVNYENLSSFLILRTWKDPLAFNDDNENLLSYHWIAPEPKDEESEYVHTGGTFQGMFQNTSDETIYLLWTLYDSITNIVEIVRREIPGKETFTSISLEPRAEMPFVNLRTNVIEDTDFRLGYCSDTHGQGCYTLAFRSEFDFEDFNSPPENSEVPYSEKTRYAQNYIGKNSIFTGEYTGFPTQLSSFDYGVVDYVHNPYPIKEVSNYFTDVASDEYNSLDRLDEYLTLVTFNNSVFNGWGNELSVKNYNLNSDASFIPSYCGLRGFMRIWASELYREKKINNIKIKTLRSIELLGYSYNSLKDKFNDFSKGLFTDEDGISVGVDPRSVLSSGFRVYEQYMADSNGKQVKNMFFKEVYNDVMDFGGQNTASWEIDLNDMDLRGDTSGTYKVLLYAVNRGANNPIYACSLSDLNTPNIDHYCLRGTYADDVYLSNRYISPYVIAITGTPNVLVDDFNPYIATGETNYIMGIGSVKSNYNDRKITFTFTKHDEVVDDPSFVNVKEMIIDKNTLVAMVYTENLWEFNDYHMLYHHHGDWPFLSVFNRQQDISGKTKDKDYFYASEISATELSNYMGHFEKEHYDENPDGTIVKPLVTHDLDAISGYPGGKCPGGEGKEKLKVINNGTYSFKINEEMESEMDFPPTAWEDVMRGLFDSINTRFNNLSSVLKNGNTYVFELQPPKEIADIIGNVEMLVYGDDGGYIRVYEEYVSSMYHVSKYRKEFIPYIHFFEGDVTGANVSHGIIYECDSEGRRIWDKEKEEWKMKSDKDKDFPTVTDDLYDFVNKNALASKVWGTIKMNDYHETNSPVGTVSCLVTEQDIMDATKIYANYDFEKDDGNSGNDKINLYFNYNNFFNSPFQYRNNRGQFSRMYKPNTFLSVAPGETGDLNVLVQLKYYNYMGKTCGLKDIPILNYTIKNISDDKPKFSIYNTWCTSQWQIAPSKKAATRNDMSAWISAEWKIVGYRDDRPDDPNPLSAYLMEDYTIDSDISATMDIVAGSLDSPVMSLTCDVIYEYTNPYLEIVPDLFSGQGAIFDLSKKGIIHVRGGNKFTIGFKVKKGAVIDEETCQIVVPVDIMNFGARDVNLMPYKHTYSYMGGIIFDFSVKGNKLNRFLALEKHNERFNGFEITGDRRLIKIFRNKKYELEEN